jgi:hypothetical protein
MWLLSHLVKLRTKHLRQAFARWREWETHEASEKLRAALSNSAKGAKYESQGQARSEAQRVAPGPQIKEGLSGTH